MLTRSLRLFRERRCSSLRICMLLLGFLAGILCLLSYTISSSCHLISLCSLSSFVTGRRFVGVVSAASLALWQSYCLRYLTPPERTSRASRLVTPSSSVPLGISTLVIFSSSYSGSSVTLFGLPSPLRMAYWLLAQYVSLQPGAVSPKFSPPVCYQLSLAQGLSLLRAHLHPAPLLPSLVFPLGQALLVVTR